MRFFHGGPPGLTEILPSAATGAPSGADYGAEGVCRRDRVYLTTSLSCARAYALFAPVRGLVTVYECEPVGELVPDPDCTEPGLSWQCERATVVRIVERIKPKARARLLGGLSR